MKHAIFILSFAATGVHAQITCQHFGNTSTCNNATFGAPVATQIQVTPQIDIAAAISAKRQADAAQTAANAQMIQAQAQAQLAQSQIEAQKARRTPPPPEQALAAMSPDARRAQIGMQAAQASTDTLRQALPAAQHLCETTGSDVYCDTAKIGEKELAWRAAHEPTAAAARSDPESGDAATWARIEAREAKHGQEAKP
jgi:hypothetical protein